MLRRKLLGAVCATLAFAVAPDPSGHIGAARAALVIHGPDGRPVMPLGFEGRDEPLLLSPDADARALQLSEDEAHRYRRIFALQENGDWDAADWEIRQLTDKRLLGHVLRQRYLHPDRKAAFDELVSWLRTYGDLPGAERIHQLAERRTPSGQRPPKPPRPPTIDRLNGSLERLAGAKPRLVMDEGAAPEPEAASDAAPDSDGDAALSVAPRSRTATRKAATQSADEAVASRIDALLSAGNTDAAASLLGSDELARRLDQVQYDGKRARVAAALYYGGKVSEALSLASSAAARSGGAVPDAHWIAGLAAWRLKEYDRATRHFDAMVAARPKSPWRLAAAAYWAARGHRRKGETERADTLLAAAAQFPHTFYGLVAARTLGSLATLNWRLPELGARHLAALAARPGGARAIALLQAGQKDMAEEELLRIHPHGDAAVEEALVVIADRAGLPELALQVGNAVTAPGGAPYDAALFPVPHWRPRDGFTVDRALVFAVMRQESRFERRMVSPAGATGLMQIMPSTVEHLRERNTDIDEKATARAALFDPATNMELGQRYLAEMLGTPEIGGNLLLAAAAYNAGPGNLQRWRRELEGMRDPLLFMESVPFGETRDYIEKVLANFWLYRLRLGQELTSLDAVAAGRWPVYMPVDARPTQVAQHAED